jgi:hypothetical protein
MNAKTSNFVVMILFCAVVLFGNDLTKQDQEKLRKAFMKGQAWFLVCPYLEGDVKGLHIYNIRANAAPEFKPSWRDVINPELRLLRGDKVVVESIDARGDYFELRIKSVERKTAHPTSSQRLVGTAILGLPGMAAGQGEYNLQPQSKLRFFGKSAEEIQALVGKFLSSQPPTIDLKPGMSPDEVRQIAGDPTEIIVFGNKKTLRYPNMDVVFVDDKLESVAFRDPVKK